MGPRKQKQGTELESGRNLGQIIGARVGTLILTSLPTWCQWLVLFFTVSDTDGGPAYW